MVRLASLPVRVDDTAGSDTNWVRWKRFTPNDAHRHLLLCAYRGTRAPSFKTYGDIMSGKREVIVGVTTLNTS